jgi:hypothetical protein
VRMGTHSKAAHQAYSVAPSISRADPGTGAAADGTADTPGEWISDAQTGDGLGAALASAASGLPPDQPKALHDLLTGDWKPGGTAGAGQPEDPGAPEVPGPAVASPATGEPEPAAEAPGQPEPVPADDSPDSGGPWADALISVPDAPPEGVAAGVPVLVGGEDLADSAATLIAYASPRR